MSEIKPHFSYDLDGVLEISKNFSKDVSQERLDQILGAVVEDSRFELIENDGTYIARTKPLEYLLEGKAKEPSHEVADDIIAKLSGFTFVDYLCQDDCVFSLDWISNRGMQAAVYPHLQRWFNTDEPKNVSDSVISAMADVYGPKTAKPIVKRSVLNIYSNGFNSGDGGMSVGFAMRANDFRVLKFVEDPVEPRYDKYQVDWNWPNLSTIGSCACLGVDGMERGGVFMHQETPRLYDITPHNVDYGIQSLSLALGMARIAYFASKYQGEEDILANATMIK